MLLKAVALTLVAAGILAAALALHPLPEGNVEASYPGANGKLLFHGSDAETGDNGWFTVNVDGSELALIVKSAEGLTAGVWSPDGRQIAFAGTTQGGVPAVIATDATGHGREVLYKSNIPGRIPGGAITWSPDGGEIAFGTPCASNEACNWNPQEGLPSHIVVVDLKSGAVTETMPEVWQNLTPRWSPVDNTIAFTGTNYGASYIYTMNPGGGGITQATSVQATNPEWSPDGNLLYFAGGASGVDTGLYVGDRLLVPDAYSGTWSPDGTRVAFARSVQTPTTIVSRILLVTPTGKRAGAVPLPPSLFVADGTIQWQPVPSACSIEGEAANPPALFGDVYMDWEHFELAAKCFHQVSASTYYVDGRLRANGLDLTTDGAFVIEDTAGGPSISAKGQVTIDVPVPPTLFGTSHVRLYSGRLSGLPSSLRTSLPLRGVRFDSGRSVNLMYSNPTPDSEGTGQTRLAIPVVFPSDLASQYASNAGVYCKTGPQAACKVAPVVHRLATVVVTNRHGAEGDVAFDVPDVRLGGTLGIKKLKVGFSKATGEWEVSGRVDVPLGGGRKVGIEATGTWEEQPSGRWGLNGFGAKAVDIPLGSTGFKLTRIGFKVYTDRTQEGYPLKVSVGGGIGWGSLVEVTGSVNYLASNPDGWILEGGVTLGSIVEFKGTGRLVLATRELKVNAELNLGFPDQGLGIRGGQLDMSVDGKTGHFRTRVRTTIVMPTGEFKGIVAITNRGIKACGKQSGTAGLSGWSYEWGAVRAHSFSGARTCSL